MASAHPPHAPAPHQHPGMIHQHPGILHQHPQMPHQHPGILHHHSGAVHHHPGFVHHHQHPGTDKEKPDKVDDDDLYSTSESEEGIITKVKKRRRIVLSRRGYLLGALILITLLSIAGVLYAAHRKGLHGYPPVYYANEASSNAYTSLVCLMIISPVGFFILKFRVTNMLIGLAYMFGLVLCVIYPTKSLINCFLSYTYDTDSTLHQYVASDADSRKLHKFWSYYQFAAECCGTRDIDRIEDWTHFLNDTREIPATCCTVKWKRTFNEWNRNGSERICGKGLARTRRRGLPEKDQFQRVPSGFFLTLTESQKEKLHRNLKIEVNPDKYKLQQMNVMQEYEYGKIEKKSATKVFLQNWKTLYMDERCNLAYEIDLKETNLEASTGVPYRQPENCDNPNKTYGNDMYSPGVWNLSDGVDVEPTVGYFQNATTLHDQCLKRVSDSSWAYLQSMEKSNRQEAINDFCMTRYNVSEEMQNATTLGNELLLNLDLITSHIHEVSEADNSDVDRIKSDFKLKGRWVLWLIPTHYDRFELLPFKLHSNLLRVNLNDSKDLKNTPQSEAEKTAQRMYYLSRGISENFVLSSLIHPKPCGAIEDNVDGDKFKNKLARDLNKRWMRYPPLSDWKNPDEGLGYYFLNKVQEIVHISLIVSAVSIAFVIVIAIVFWQYYSRIKAEEYANLALPKEFEVLHLRRGSLLDEGEMKLEPVRRLKMMGDAPKRKKKKKENVVTVLSKPTTAPGSYPYGGYPLGQMQGQSRMPGQGNFPGQSHMLGRFPGPKGYTGQGTLAKGPTAKGPRAKGRSKTGKHMV